MALALPSMAVRKLQGAGERRLSCKFSVSPPLLLKYSCRVPPGVLFRPPLLRRAVAGTKEGGGEMKIKMWRAPAAAAMVAAAEEEQTGGSGELAAWKLEGGGIVPMLMSTTTASTARVSPYLWTLAGNPTFVSGLVALILAQVLKMLHNSFVERRWDFGLLFSSGGKPSSHSALCMGLTTAVALCMGVAVGNCGMEEKQIFQNV